MSEALTYHGVEVPVWEDRRTPEHRGAPEGPGWMVAATIGDPGGGRTICWRRPHPWRVMLEGVWRTKANQVGDLRQETTVGCWAAANAETFAESVRRAAREARWRESPMTDEQMAAQQADAYRVVTESWVALEKIVADLRRISNAD